MSQVIAQPELAVTTARPLCVDLDGTLVKSDTLIDSLLLLARTRPHLAPALFVRVLRGKAPVANPFFARMTLTPSNHYGLLLLTSSGVYRVEVKSP